MDRVILMESTFTEQVLVSDVLVYRPDNDNCDVQLDSIKNPWILINTQRLEILFIDRDGVPVDFNGVTYHISISGAVIYTGTYDSRNNIYPDRIPLSLVEHSVMIIHFGLNAAAEMLRNIYMVCTVKTYYVPHTRDKVEVPWLKGKIRFMYGYAGPTNDLQFNSYETLDMGNGVYSMNYNNEASVIKSVGDVFTVMCKMNATAVMDRAKYKFVATGQEMKVDLRPIINHCDLIAGIRCNKGGPGITVNGVDSTLINLKNQLVSAPVLEIVYPKIWEMQLSNLTKGQLYVVEIECTFLNEHRQQLLTMDDIPKIVHLTIFEPWYRTPGDASSHSA